MGNVAKVASFRGCSDIHRMYIRSVIRPRISELRCELQLLEDICNCPRPERAAGAFLAFMAKVPAAGAVLNEALRSVLPLP